MRKPSFFLTVLLYTSLFACRKSESTNPVTPTPATTAYTAGIGGMRNWHGHHSYSATGMHYPTPVHESWDYPDTSFAIIIIDDSTISYNGVTFIRERSDSVKQIHYFGSVYYAYQYNNGTGVAYYYGSNSIEWCTRFLHTTSDYISRSDYYRTY